MLPGDISGRTEVSVYEAYVGIAVNMPNKPDPLQNHPREWPSTPYSDEARTEEPPFENSCCIVLFGDCTVSCGLWPSANRPQNHLAIRLRRTFPDQLFIIRNMGEDGGTIGGWLENRRFEELFQTVPLLDIAFIRYGINDRKYHDIPRCISNLREFCTRVRQHYVMATIIIETGIWVDYPKHYMFDRNSRLAPLYNAMREFAGDEGYPLIDVFKNMEIETQNGNWDLRVRGLPAPETTVLDDSFDEFYGNDPAFFTNIHPNSRGMG